MKQLAEHKSHTEKQPNYKLRRGLAIGGIALASAVGAHELFSSPQEEPETKSYTTAIETLELGQGDTVIDAAINGARNIQPELSEADQSRITKQAQAEALEHNVVQPGYEVTVRYGEYDNKPDANGELGTDFEVEVTPNVIK